MLTTRDVPEKTALFVGEVWRSIACGRAGYRSARAMWLVWEGLRLGRFSPRVATLCEWQKQKTPIQHPCAYGPHNTSVNEPTLHNVHPPGTYLAKRTISTSVLRRHGPLWRALPRQGSRRLLRGSVTARGLQSSHVLFWTSRLPHLSLIHI